MKEKEKDFWDDLSISQQCEIQKGIKELNEGKRVSWKSVLKKIKIK
jgi:hypothetical protein